MKQLRRDHQQQYAIIRDYAMELKERNKDTTVKIQVETNTGLTLNSNVFKRIYVFLGPLKDGYKALRRDLLDRQKVIVQALSQLFPSVEHRFCVRHIYDSMEQIYKGRASTLEIMRTVNVQEVIKRRPRKKRRVTQYEKSEKALKQQMVKNRKLSRKGNTMSYGTVVVYRSVVEVKPTKVTGGSSQAMDSHASGSQIRKSAR
ncbi:hypothetical protein Tco_0025343 [Tanacetum coccineum]